MQQRKMNRSMLDNYGGDVSHMRQMGGGGSGGYGSHGGGSGNYSNLSQMGGFSNNQMGGYGGQGNQGYGGQGVLGSTPGLGGSGGGFGMGGGGSGGLDMDALLQQRQLQQQLSLRESQLALANSLLLQQQQQGMDVGPGMRGGRNFNMGNMGMDRGLMMNKRRGDMNQGDMRSDYNKRPRREFRSPPGNRDRRRSREYDGGSGGNRNSGYRRNQNSSSSSSRPGRSSEQDSAKAKASTEVYDPEKPTSDEDETSAGDKKKGGGSGEKKDQFYCHVCKINCRDGPGFRMHMNGARHKQRMVDVLAEHQEKSTQLVARMKAEEHLRKIEVKDKPSNKQFCKTCDQEVNVRLVDHYRHVVHRKRLVQVNRGCGWCHTGSFKNFSDVLAHRETKEHKEQQSVHEKEGRKDGEKDDSSSSSRSPRNSSDKGRESSKGKSPRAGGSDRRLDKGRGNSKDDNKKKEPPEIKVELPAKLQKFDANIAVGQNCIVPVTGFFCKLCNKFYNNEAAAKDTHCKTEPHFTKYQKFVYAKLKAKAEADRAAAEKVAAEKAAAEAKEKAEKEAEMKKDGEDVEMVAENDETTGENAGTSKSEATENAEKQIEDDEEEAGEEEDEENTNKGNEKGAEEDEEMDEDHDENAILAEDGSAVQDAFYDEEEAEDLLNEGETDGSAYATAGDDTVALESANTTANDTADAGLSQGASLGTSEVSLVPGASLSEFLAESSQNEGGAESQVAESSQNDDGGDGDAEDQVAVSVSMSGDMEGDGSQQDEDGEGDVATEDTPSSVTKSAPRASSTPARGRGGSRGANRARRGRKVAK